MLQQGFTVLQEKYLKLTTPEMSPGLLLCDDIFPGRRDIPYM